MRKALKLEGGAAADEVGLLQQGLEGDDHLFPAYRSARATVDARGGLFQPAGGDIVTAQRRRVAPLRKPGGIDQQTLRELGEQVV